MERSFESNKKRVWFREYYQNMKRNKKKHYKDYITARIAQLRDDALKASDPHDRTWYYRLIMELKWVQDYE